MARRRGPSLTRQHVVDAAIRCIEAEGPAAAGVSRVARELGIKPPSIYNHVGKGDALERAISIEGNRRLMDALKPSVRGIVAPQAQLHTLAVTTRDWARAHPHLYALMARVPPDNEHPDFVPILTDMFDLFGRPLGQLGLTGPAALHAIRGLRASLHGFILLENSGQFALAEAPEESFHWLLDTILRGIAAPPIADH